jgi:branched-chain amino acid transport system permease protein
MITLGIGELVFAMSLMFPGVLRRRGRRVGQPCGWPSASSGITFGPAVAGVLPALRSTPSSARLPMFAFTRTPLGRMLNAGA